MYLRHTHESGSGSHTSLPFTCRCEPGQVLCRASRRGNNSSQQAPTSSCVAQVTRVKVRAAAESLSLLACWSQAGTTHPSPSG